MPQYYYDKFTVIETPIYEHTYTWGSELNTFEYVKTGYESFSFDKNTGKFTLTGAQLTANSYNGGPSPVFTLSGNTNQQLIQNYIQVAGLPIMFKMATVTQKLVRTDYSKGSLVQSNIAAEDGTYPSNGRHMDGYWYVKGAVVNTAPTMPGAFTQPSGNLEIGDSKVFAVGSSSDAEGNLSKYIWEASVNGGAFSKVGETTVNSLTYTIPTATSLKMRVKAVDTTGLESAYRDSSLYTVIPPQYWWQRYTAIERFIYVLSWKELYSRNGITAILLNGYTSFNFDSQTGSVVPNGSRITAGLDSSNHISPAYDFGQYSSYPGHAFYRILSSPSSPNNFTFYGSVITQQSDGHIKGSYKETIQAGYAAYVDNVRNTDNYWYVRGSRVNQSIAPPKPFTSPTTGKKFKPNEVATITFGASNASNLSLYEVDYRYNITGAWTPLPYNNTLTRSLRITTDKALKTLELRVRAKDTGNVYSDYVYSETFEIEHNVVPTVTLTGPGENTTLYENDTFTIAGTAYDDDADQSVTVYYQINSEQRKVLATNLSKTQIALSKQLIFKGGKLFDGEVVLTDTLAEGVPHTLKVWAVDNEGAQSATIERTFYVVPNRAPLLSVDAVVPSGIINTDKFKISGTASDQDANSNIKVNYRINGANPVEVYNGAGGAWEFEVSLAQLVVNENTIIIEVIDNYDAKTSKTIKLNKNELKTPILQSVARYKISPPKGSARGVLIWVQRDEELDLKVELSMTLVGEQEQYVLLEADPDKIVPVTDGIVEDEYYHETVEPKDNIILKLTTTRPNINIDNKIYLIMGVVE
ncbi:MULTISPECIES: Ig-like domain-containing protein [Lysinibacillus]|uniref:Ig-like domain-containing protein n=1 Tax=Lysinibacillus TaxID=400634 RepID=UPI00214C8E56|nr:MULTISPECIES: Ig-like domain-containing protein [Lysinibacillus]UUV27045.1 Ig-like domain-containing protein [Lysinibacillus sp. FN11]UYB45306.1 Ig-like domain-containing protein [Lysinibacillus capsici]